MEKYLIRYGLGGSFGGATEERIVEARDKDEAYEIAYELACENFEQYDGLHGIRSTNDIMEEDDLNEEEALERWCEERESWLEYEVEKVG